MRAIFLVLALSLLGVAPAQADDGESGENEGLALSVVGGSLLVLGLGFFGIGMFGRTAVRDYRHQRAQLARLSPDELTELTLSIPDDGDVSNLDITVWQAMLLSAGFGETICSGDDYGIQGGSAECRRSEKLERLGHVGLALGIISFGAGLVLLSLGATKNRRARTEVSLAGSSLQLSMQW